MKSVKSWRHFFHFAHYLSEEFKMNTKLATSRMRTGQWADIINDCKDSGLKVDYCAQHGLSWNAYFYWLIYHLRLIAVVNAEFKRDPTESNYIFLFCGRRCDRIKALLYEGDGWLLCYKRFTDGKQQWPRSTSEARTLTPQQYRWLMEGLSIDQKKAILLVKPELY